MGRISNDFFSDDSCHLSIESKLNFLIDNYLHLMKIFHLIDKKMAEVLQEKEEAIVELNDLRKQEKKHRIMEGRGQKVDDRDKQELEEKTKYCKELIRESQPISNGKTLETDHCTLFVINNYKWFRRLDYLDSKVRNPIASIVGGSIRIALYPFNYMIFKTIIDTKEGNIQDFLIKVWKKIDDVPDNFREHIKSS